MPSARHVASCFLDACQVFVRGVRGRNLPPVYVALGRNLYEHDTLFLGLFDDFGLAEACAERAARLCDPDGTPLTVEVFAANVHADPLSYHPSTYVD